MFHLLIAYSFIHSFNNCIIFLFFPSSEADTHFHNPSIIKYIISASEDNKMQNPHPYPQILEIPHPIHL